MSNLAQLSNDLATNGGFSYSLSVGDVAGTMNYSVSVSKDSERIFQHSPTDGDIRRYMSDYSAELASEDVILGGWEHEGEWFLDISELLPKEDYELAQAVAIGAGRDQIAIFDLEHMKEIACR